MVVCNHAFTCAEKALQRLLVNDFAQHAKLFPLDGARGLLSQKCQRNKLAGDDQAVTTC